MKRLGLLILLGTLLFAAVTQTNAAPQAPSIVGGSPAAAGEFPHMVSIGYRNPNNGFNAHFCGGSLIKPDVVLTAAHCLEGESAGELAVIINRLDLRQSGGEKINVKRIINHAGYNSDTLNNDIALLELATPSQQGTIVVPVLANEPSFETSGRTAWVTGWGDTTDGGSGSPKLLKVGVPLVGSQTCSSALGGGLTANMVCAGLKEGGKDSCQNDSGGPLVTKDGNGNWRQVGVVSWGYGCAQANSYGVYARVSRYEAWLEQRVGELQPPTIPTQEPDTKKFNNHVFLPVLTR